MSEPCYQIQGPSISEVRGDVLDYIIKNHFNKDISDSKKIYIENIILKIIPNTRNDFGSYRGYHTFNIPKNLSSQVMKEIEIQNKALSTLKNKLTPYVQHHLYKPGGKRMKQVAETTLVGKKKIDL
jgi:hypothetical protein